MHALCSAIHGLSRSIVYALEKLMKREGKSRNCSKIMFVKGTKSILTNLLNAHLCMHTRTRVCMHDLRIEQGQIVSSSMDKINVLGMIAIHA